MSHHAYHSTACLHGKHEACRITCKFCDELCMCRCHLAQRLAGQESAPSVPSPPSTPPPKS